MWRLTSLVAGRDVTLGIADEVASVLKISAVEVRGGHDEGRRER
jgi:hypothetical protein